MLKLLKIVDKVEKPVMINEAVSLNISANGDCPDDITAILGKLVNLSNPSSSTQDMTPHGGHKDMMMKTIADVDGYADGAAHEYADEMGEEYANEPDPEISDVEYMTKDLAGGLNKPKKQFKKEYPGDNPMTMEEARAAELMREYKAIKEGRMDELSPDLLDRYRDKVFKSDTTQIKDPNKKFSRNMKYPQLAAGKIDPERAALHGLKVKVPAKEETDPRDSRPETYRSNNTGYAWDKLSTRSSSNPKDSKATKSGKQLGLKHSIKGALGSHGPKGHLPEATDKKPTDDAKKKKSEKMKAYRADRDKHGED